MTGAVAILRSSEVKHRESEYVCNCTGYRISAGGRRGQYRRAKSLPPEKGVDINVTNRQKRTAIIIASLKKHYACVEFLIAAGADIDKQDQTCFNPFPDQLPDQ